MGAGIRRENAFFFTKSYMNLLANQVRALSKAAFPTPSSVLIVLVSYPPEGNY